MGGWAKHTQVALSVYKQMDLTEHGDGEILLRSKGLLFLCALYVAISLETL